MILRRLGFLAVLLALAGGASAGTLEWTCPRRSPAGDATARWNAPEGAARPAEWHYRGRADRRYRHGLAVWGSPAAAVVEGRPMIFIGGYDQAMHALDLLARERAWVRLTNGPIQEAPAIGFAGGEQVVFWGSGDRTVYAHRARDGELVWTREIIEPTSTMEEARLSAPLLHRDMVLVNAFIHDRALGRSIQRGWLIALDRETGRLLWRHEISQGPVSSPVGLVLDGRFTVFAAARKGLLQALAVSREGADPLWSFQMPQEVLGSPALEEDTDDPLLFLGSKYGNLIALDARTGTERWQKMAGNWIDNSAAVGRLDGRAVVFIGSHDYHLYAFEADGGREIWRRRLGGEIYSAPVFFEHRGRPMVAAAALDDRLYVLDARDGTVRDAYRTGSPVWDALSRGEILWASPIAIEYAGKALLAHGSYSAVVYILPLEGESMMRVSVQSTATLWMSMGIVLAVFLLLILPPVLLIPAGDGKNRPPGESGG